MNSLENYIKKVESETKELNDIEKIRYVYLDLGKRLSFNLDFSFGNSKMKRKIYRESPNKENLNNALKSNTIICKSSSYMFQYILEQLGINNITTVTDPRDYLKLPHVYNSLTADDGKEYIFDLQSDLENIQSHSRTKYFGISEKEEESALISRFDLEQIDKKLEYIKDNFYYSDDYLYLLKSDIGYFDDLQQKVQFVLENLEVYENKKMKYAERKWFHEGLIKKLFSIEEQRKIHMVDCYKEIKGKKDYQICIIVDGKEKDDYYLYSKENGYNKKTINEFLEEKQKGLNHLQKISQLKRNQKKEEKNDAR